MSNSTNRIYYPLDTSQTKKSPARRVTSPKTTKTGIRNNYNKSPKNNTDMNSMHDTNYSYRSINNEEINQTNYRENSMYSQTKTQNIPSSSDQNNNQDDEDLVSYWTEKAVVQNVDLSNPRISCKIKREILPELIKNLQSVRDACIVEGLSELSCQADAAVMACKNLLKEKRVDESSNTQTKNIQERLDQAKQELRELQERITIQEANMLNEFQSQSRKLKEKHKKELKSLQNEWFVQETIDEPLPKQDDSENDLDQVFYDSMYPTAVNRNVKSPRSNYNNSILGDDNNDDIFASNNYDNNANTAKKAPSNSYINDIEYMDDFAKDTIDDPTEFDNNREQFFNNNPKKERTSNSTKRKSKRKRSTKTNYKKSTKDQIYDETPNNQNDHDSSSKQNSNDNPSENGEFNSFLKPFFDIANNIIESDNTNQQKSGSQSSNESDSDKQSQNNDDRNSAKTKSSSASAKKTKSNKQIKSDLNNSKNNDSENLSVNDSDSQNKDDLNNQNKNDSDSQHINDINSQNKNDSDIQNKDDSDIQNKNDSDIQNKDNSDIQNKNDSDIQNKDDSDIQNKNDSDIQNKDNSDNPNDDDSQNNQTKNTSSNLPQLPNANANVFDNAVKRFTYNVLPKNNDDLFDIDVNNYSESESSVYNNVQGDENGSIESVSVDENYSSAPDDSETLDDSEILMTSDEQNENDNQNNNNDDDESGDEEDGKDMIKKLIGNAFGKMTKNDENNSEGNESEKEEKESKSNDDNEDKNNDSTKNDDENNESKNNNDENNITTKNEDKNNDDEDNDTTKNVDENKNNDDENNDITKNVVDEDKDNDDDNDSASQNGDNNDTSNIRSDSKSSNHSKSHNSEAQNLADGSDKDDTQSDKNDDHSSIYNSENSNADHTDDEDKLSHHSEHTKSTNNKNAFEDTDDQYDDINNKSDNDSLSSEKLDKKATSNIQKLLGNGNDSVKSRSSKQTSESNTKSVSRSSKQTTQSNTTSISRSSKQTTESAIDDTSSQHTKNSSIPPSKIFKRFFSDMPDLSTTTRSEEDMKVDDDKISLKKPKGYKQPNEQPNQNQRVKPPLTDDQFNEPQNTTNKETANMNQTQQNQQQQQQPQKQNNPSTTCQKKKQKPTREMTSTELMQAPISHVVNKSQLPSKADIKSATYKKERRLRHYNKTSTQLRILRRQAAFLEKENKHEEAKIVMQQADAIEKEEVLSSTLQMRQDYEKNLESLLIRQEQEMEQLKKNQSIKRTKYENAKQESISILQRRIEKLQNEIKIASDKERANALFQRKSSLHKKNPIPTSKYQISRDRRKKDNRNDITSEVKSANLEDGHFFDEENQASQNLEDDGPSKSEEDQESEIDTKLSLNRNASKKKTVESSGLNRFNYYTYTSKINKNAPPGLSPALNQSLMQQLHLNVNKSLDKMNQKNPLARKRRYPTAVSMPLTSRRQVNQAEFNRIKLPPLNASLEAKKIIKSNEKKMRLNRDYM